MHVCKSSHKLGDVSFKLTVCYFSLLIWKWFDITTAERYMLQLLTLAPYLAFDHQSMRISFGWHILSLKDLKKIAISYNLTVCKVRGFITEGRQMSTAGLEFVKSIINGFTQMSTIWYICNGLCLDKWDIIIQNIRLNFPTVC